MSGQDSNVQLFSPGNNLWKRMPRILFFSFERLGVLAAVFGVAYLCTMSMFSYDWPITKVLFVVTMVVLGIFLVLPAPSNPLRLMWQEVLVRPFIGIKQGAVNGSVIVRPLEGEED